MLIVNVGFVGDRWGREIEERLNGLKCKTLDSSLKLFFNFSSSNGSEALGLGQLQPVLHVFCKCMS